jgi:glucosamine--fructose-6-phosphate aminotransferase (isomerizing)
VTGRSTPAEGDPFLTEIAGQPEAIRRAARAIAGQVEQLRRLAVDRPDGALVMTGMGSSYDACHVAVTVLAEAGRTANLINAAELLHFRTATLDGRTVLVVVSQSGHSVEIVRLLERLAERPDRPFVVAITNGLDNPLAAGADLAFDTQTGGELGPATMSFAASLVALDAVARVLATGPAADLATIVRQVEADAEAAAQAAEMLIAGRAAITATMVDWLGARPNLVILGRGVARATAEMAALTIKEVAGAPVEALVTADFRHGPLELVDPDLAVAFVALEPATDAIDRSFAAELAAGPVAVVVVGGPADGQLAGDGSVRLGATLIGSVVIAPVDRRLAPAVAMIPFQLLAREMAIARGRQPGQFSFASKVTTRE